MATIDELQKAYKANVPTSAGDTGAAKPQPAPNNNGNANTPLAADKPQVQPPSLATPTTPGGAAKPNEPTTAPNAPAAPNTPATPTTPADPGAVPPNVGNMINGQYTTGRTEAIQAMFDAQKKALEEQYKAAFDRQQSAEQAAAEKIPQQYQAQANDLAVQHERNKRNMNLQAAGNGLNTGTASQMALALNSQWQRDYGGVKQAQANAQAEAERRQADLKAQYEAQVAAALAKNDFEKANALMNEYNRSEEWALKNAQIMAQFGDFSLYSKLYGDKQAAGMEAIWKAQNPDLAWQSGKLTAGEYEAITGKKPNGAQGYDDTINNVLEEMKKNPYSSGGGGSTYSDYINSYWNSVHKGQSGSAAAPNYKGWENQPEHVAAIENS